ncbi:Uma2 family endonuclease [Streptomyces blastmyceticus]|uniref:Putative restriction endonuclease domain-containing protein n=1 Tax=Streptomyces blastmyceticus TaxID=68180 RepID=A0ABP3FY44_9ACTN
MALVSDLGVEPVPLSDGCTEKRARLSADTATLSGNPLTQVRKGIMAVMVEIPRGTVREISPTPDPGGFEGLCRVLEKIEMHLPDGYRSEIVRGRITVSPWSKGKYRPVLVNLVRQLEPHTPEGHLADRSPLLFRFPDHSRSYGPDVHVSDEELTNIDSIHLPGEALSLVGELTSSSTADFDRLDKVEVYGKAGVQVYVLVDVLNSTVTVYSSPSETGYRRHTQVKFGDKVRVPAPFDFELDTSEWKA